MKEVHILFPHQLFESSDQLEIRCPVYLVEEFLFFKEFNFHKQKIAYHRATMKFYAQFLEVKGLEVHYIESCDDFSDIRLLVQHLSEIGVNKIYFTDPTDNWLEKRLIHTSKKAGIELKAFSSPQWLNSRNEIRKKIDNSKKKYFLASFYKSERLTRSILVEGNSQPFGGKWSYDEENRLRYPKGKTPPIIVPGKTDEFYEEAKSYVERFFPSNPGELSTEPIYPINFRDANGWLQEFLESRFSNFGNYEDAIVHAENFLHHSVLTPMLNSGLITPKFVLQSILSYALENSIPLNSTEGFVRQIIGWREFVRGVYLAKGTEERNQNFWKFNRKIPTSFYNGTTGIFPLDETIRKVKETGYCHHTERLMVLGNFMLLCEFDPDEVYRWFMEMFIDSYDWVMVPNVYGMSQFADGGVLSTKPYISGSNYLIKMSDYAKGEWQEAWDALFWRFISNHREFFLKNPRTSMMVKNYDKMANEKKEEMSVYAQDFLNNLV